MFFKVIYLAPKGGISSSEEGTDRYGKSLNEMYIYPNLPIGITGDSKKGDNLFLEIVTFSGKATWVLTLPTII